MPTAVAALLLALLGWFSTQAHAATVVVMDLNHVVHPLTAEILEDAVGQAEAQNADAVLIRLDTPGGLLTATEHIIQTIVGSPVPVVTFVTPSGGKAASAGFMILLAGDIAAMSPGTNTGAAHPVMLGGGEMDEVMKQKTENDAAARMRSIADKRGRNIELAEAAVRESKSFTEEEALEQSLIDLIANDDAALMAALDGRQVVRFDGAETTLRLAGAVLQPVELSFRQRLLLPLIDPSIAFVLLLVGALCIYVEFTNPGLILPGVLGGLFAIVGLMALSLLPINWAGAALIVFGIGCFVAEALTITNGILAIGGAIAMTLGIVMLVDTDIPELSIGWGVAAAVTVPFAAITVFLLQLAVRSFRYKVTTGAEALIGAVGVAKTEIGSDGRVFVHGELWNAEAAAPIASGAKVRVAEIEGLRLKVEPVERG